MRRQIIAVAVGVVLAVAVIYGIFDQRIHLSDMMTASPTSQSRSN